jgi:putative SOS response-associated peptidase YedK
MSVILHSSDFNRWLDREPSHQPPIDLLRPFPADEMEAFEASKDVGNVQEQLTRFHRRPSLQKNPPFSGFRGRILPL